MKKKIILILLLIVCIASSLCVLTACSVNKVKFVGVDPIGKKYVGSSNNVYGYINFNFKSPSNCSFSFTFTVVVKNADTQEIVFTKDYEENADVIKDEDLKVDHFFDEKGKCFAGVEYAIIEVKNVKITDVESQGIAEQYDGYAMGFGIAAAVLIIGLTALFVLDKVRK